MFRAIELLSAPVELLVDGTTIATNALLERRGARVVLVTTRGFEDLLWLRRQDRAALYDLARDHPPPLVARPEVVGLAERMGPAGVQEPLSDAEVARVVAAVQALAPESVAVALLFAFRHPEHERRIAGALRGALGEVPVAASHEVLPVFREFERFSTTTVEAYLRPKVSSYLARLDREARSRVGTLRIMTSAGGTLAPPAAAGRAAVHNGTGAVAGVPLALPSILIETVSAGGGSIARLDEGGALKVGPDSAGAVPGPACYGRGGTRPTVTDACLVLAWLDAATPLADELRLDPGAAERAVAALGTGAGSDPTRIACGIVAVASAVMARALRRVSVARGLDPRRMALVPFGGAGPLFGCALADALGMRTIVVPPHPGVLSALGLAAAAERVDVLASYHRELDGLQPTDIGRAFSPLLRNGSEQLPGAALWRYVDCRFVGQGYELTIPVATNNPRQIRDAFLAAHRERLGHEGVGQAVELVNLRVVAVREAPLPQLAGNAGTTRSTAKSRGRRAVVLGRGTKRVTAALWPLDDLAAGVTLDGPAILAGRDATALIESGWRGTVHQSGAILVERV